MAVPASGAGNEEAMGIITLGQAAQWCGGRIDPKYQNITFTGANMDTRLLQPGQLFIALQGSRDGHDFIPAAMEKGAAAVLCSRDVGDIPAIVVEDPRKALGDIARQERRRIGMKVVGVTGSVGKSTTKEMIACVLGGTFRVAKTPANHNNDLGMPMAILAMGEDTQIAVLEMGMNHAGEIAYLSQIAAPDVSVIVNVGVMHIENLGSRENIRDAKLEIISGMEKTGLLLLNGDDDMLWPCRETLPVQTRCFGKRQAACPVFAENIRHKDDAMEFTVCYDGVRFPVHLPVEGEHNVTDALAAVAVGLAFGIPDEQIAARLAAFETMEGRQQLLQARGCTIIKDCYNAGPESMAAALQVLGSREGRRIAVLGDMLELGECAEREHWRVGQLAAEKTHLLLAYGPNACHMVQGAKEAGMEQAQAFLDKGEMAAALRSLAKEGDVILFKGSRGMRMEQVLEAFTKET